MEKGLTRVVPANLPAEVDKEMEALRASPGQYLSLIAPEGASEARPAGAVMVSQLKRGLGRNEAMLAISLMIGEVRDWFNVKGNMTDRQIALTAEMILDNPGFYDLSLGNIKACFRRKMQTEKLYDRLDGNIIIGWLREFKSEMAEHCYLARTEEENKAEDGAMSHEVYLAMVKAKAESGDENARAIMAEYEKRKRICSLEEKRRKELEFFRFKTEYEKKKKGDSAEA